MLEIMIGNNLQNYNLKEAKKRIFDTEIKTGHLSLFLLKKKYRHGVYNISLNTNNIYPEGIIEILYMDVEKNYNDDDVKVFLEGNEDFEAVNEQFQKKILEYMNNMVKNKKRWEKWTKKKWTN